MLPKKLSNFLVNGERVVGNIDLAFKNFICRAKPLRKGKGLVIVSGMPKSGTTAIAKLLGMAIGLDVTSDPFYQLDRFGINFRESLFSGSLSLEQLWRKNRYFFKGPVVKDSNFPLLMDDLFSFLPEAKYVGLVRDPRDNIRSLLNRLKLPGDPHEKREALAEIKKNNATWYKVLTGKYLKHSGENYIEALALRWRKSAENLHKYKNKLTFIRYEDFCIDKLKSINQLALKLGFSVVKDISLYVDIQYQPKGNSNQPWMDFYGEKQLKCIEIIVGPWMKEFKYS